MQTTKRVRQSFRARKQMEGEGTTVFRAIGITQLPNLDPFMLFDDADSDDGQFPDHPHRGFEAIVYMLSGLVRHEDSQGGKGEIVEGGGQWMTTGRGIVHAEKIETRHVHAIAVWVNLKAAMKFVAPAYQQFTQGTIKNVEDRGAGISATILAGTALGETASTFTRTPASFIDFKLQTGSTLRHPMIPGWNSLLYVLDGRVTVAGASFGVKDTVVLTTEEPLLEVRAEKEARFILLSGEPINEPIVQYGPIVMNTREQIVQAFDDYYKGRNGFEGAPTWRSQLFYG